MSICCPAPAPAIESGPHPQRGCTHHDNFRWRQDPRSHADQGHRRLGFGQALPRGPFLRRRRHAGHAADPRRPLLLPVLPRRQRSRTRAVPARAQPAESGRQRSAARIGAALASPQWPMAIVECTTLRT